MRKIDRLTLTITEALNSARTARDIAEATLPENSQLYAFMNGKAQAYAEVLRLIEELEGSPNED